jgi:hypothetical protein
VEKTSFDRLVVDLRDAQLRGSEVIRLLEELDALSAGELILDLHRVSDDLVLIARGSAVQRLATLRTGCSSALRLSATPNHVRKE